MWWRLWCCTLKEKGMYMYEHGWAWLGLLTTHTHTHTHGKINVYTDMLSRLCRSLYSHQACHSRGIGLDCWTHASLYAVYVISESKPPETISYIMNFLGSMPQIPLVSSTIRCNLLAPSEKKIKPKSIV